MVLLGLFIVVLVVGFLAGSRVVAPPAAADTGVVGVSTAADPADVPGPIVDVAEDSDTLAGVVAVDVGTGGVVPVVAGGEQRVGAVFALRIDDARTSSAASEATCGGRKPSLLASWSRLLTGPERARERRPVTFSAASASLSGVPPTYPPTRPSFRA